MPETLAARIAALTFLACALDIGELAERSAQPLDRAAQIYYGAGAQFALDELPHIIQNFSALRAELESPAPSD